MKTSTDRLAHRFARGVALEGRVSHWLIAVALHLPVLYALAAITVHVQQQNIASSSQQPADANNPAPIFEPHAVIPVQATHPPHVRQEPAPGRQSVQSGISAGVPDAHATTTPAGIVVGEPDGRRAGAVLDRMAKPDAHEQLLRPTNPAPLLTGPAAVRTRVADRLAPFNDSISAERRSALRSRDWTIADSQGKRWGVAPGRIHLGSLSIAPTNATNALLPPDAIVTPPGRRDEANARVARWSEIEVQSVRAEIRATIDRRVKQIRQRLDGTRHR
jgi:hypothetical protein